MLVNNVINQKMEPLFDKMVSEALHEDSSFDSVLKMALRFEDANFYVAGGFVRNALQSFEKKSKDIDLFVSSEAFKAIKDVVTRHGKYELNPYGSIRWFPNKNLPFYYDIIVIEDFYQGLWKCENIVDVLNQFDITANAVAFDLKTKTFYNPNNGYLHIIRKELRAVRFDFPEINVSDQIPLSRNTVLWFRYNYYAKKLGFNIEKTTKKWIEENKYRSKERELINLHFFNPEEIF